MILKDFLSWEELEFDFPKGVTLIEGFNYDDNSMEGSGKSAILNGLTWTIYGDIPKDVKANQIIREGTKKSEGILNFKSGHSIKRTRTKSGGTLELILPDGQPFLGKDVKETQTYIDELMGMGYDTFLQSVYFAQNHNVKFITSDEKLRVKVLSDIADLTVFDKATKEVTSLIKSEKETKLTLENELKTAKYKVDEAQTLVIQVESYKNREKEAQKARIEALESQIGVKVSKLEGLVQFLEENDTDELEKLLEVAKTELEESETKIENLNLELSSVDSIKSERRSAESQIKAIESELNVLLSSIKNKQESVVKLKEDTSKKENILEKNIEASQTKVDRLEDKIEALKDPDNTNCPTCGSEIEPDSKHIELEVRELENSLKEIFEEVENMVISQKELEASNTLKIEVLNKEIKDLSEKTPDIEAQLANLKIELNNIKLPDLSEVSDKLEVVKSKKRKLGNSIIEIKTKIKEVEQKDNLAEELSEEIKGLEKNLEVAKSEKLSDFDKDIKAARLKVTTAKSQVKSLESLLEANTKTLRDLSNLREGFKETKSYTFKSLLRDLTNKSNYYLAQLFDLPINIEFTNETEEGGIAKITDVVSIGGAERPFALYSGGQSRRIQLAVDLALSDIVASRGDKPVGLLIMDEVCKDLSENSMEKVLELLEGLDKAVLLIEHNSIIKNIVTNTFRIELRNGVSKCL